MKRFNVTLFFKNRTEHVDRMEEDTLGSLIYSVSGNGTYGLMPDGSPDNYGFTWLPDDPPALRWELAPEPEDYSAYSLIKTPEGDYALLGQDGTALAVLSHGEAELYREGGANYFDSTEAYFEAQEKGQA